MLENIADASIKAVFFANRDRVVGADDRFGITAKTGQRENTRDARPNDREQVTPLQAIAMPCSEAASARSR